MKIALVSPASIPATQFGGIMFLAVDIAKEIAKDQHQVTIFTTDLDFANNLKTFNRNLPRIQTNYGFQINRTHVWISYQLFFVNPKMYFAIKTFRPHIIHSIGIRSFQSIIAALISKNYKIPLVISDQGGLTTHPDLAKNSLVKKTMYKLQNPFIKFIINQSTKIIVPNEYEKKIFATFGAESKVTIVRNGIDVDELYQNKIDFKKKYAVGEKFILFVGRFNKVKGIDILLRAWALINSNRVTTNKKLVIMGVDFGFESEMESMIKSLKIADTTIVIKKPPREDVIAAYAACEFLVLPSRWELSPLTPLEAFAFKKAVVSTNAHGIPHTLEDGKNCILVRPEDDIALSEAMIDLLENEDKRARLGLSGYQLVKDTCNSQEMSKRIAAVYRQIVKT